MLFHIVGTSELFVAAIKLAGDGFLCRMDLGMARGVAGGRKCLGAAVFFTVTAWVALYRLFVALVAAGGNAGAHVTPVRRPPFQSVVGERALYGILVGGGPDLGPGRRGV